MKINENAFQRMQNGIKKREYRINDEKRRQIKINDTINFLKLPDLKEEIKMKVEKIEHFNSLQEAITKYFEEDFQKRHKDIESTIQSFYEKGFCNPAEEHELGGVVFTIKKAE